MACAASPKTLSNVVRRARHGGLLTALRTRLGVDVHRVPREIQARSVDGGTRGAALSRPIRRGPIGRATACCSCSAPASWARGARSPCSGAVSSGIAKRKARRLGRQRRPLRQCTRRAGAAAVMLRIEWFLLLERVPARARIERPHYVKAFSYLCIDDLWVLSDLRTSYRMNRWQQKRP
jgi:hypothetical protein